MRFAVFAAAALALTSSAARAEEPGYLFDALRLVKFKLSWERLVKTVEPIPDWLMNFNKNYDGAAGAMTPVTVGGKPYRLSYVCEPENCAAHKFAVLFDADGSHAFGALGGNDAPPAFFGKPAPAEEEALAQAFHPAAPKAEGATPAQSKSE
jgi:hypothetical protein